MACNEENEKEISCTIYISNLSKNTTIQELDIIFRHYGQIKNISLSKNPAGFAFVEMDNTSDTKNAITSLNGTIINGNKVKVNFYTSSSKYGHRKRSISEGHTYGENNEENKSEKNPYFNKKKYI